MTGLDTAQIGEPPPRVALGSVTDTLDRHERDLWSNHLGVDPMTAERVQDALQEILSCQTVLSDRITETRCTYAAEALLAGVDVERVATAMRTPVPSLAVSLRIWLAGNGPHYLDDTQRARVAEIITGHLPPPHIPGPDIEADAQAVIRYAAEHGDDDTRAAAVRYAAWRESAQQAQVEHMLARARRHGQPAA